MIKTLLLISAFFYLASGLPIFLGNTLSKKRQAYILGAIGFILHSLAMISVCLNLSNSPMSDPYGLPLSISWLIALIQLAIPIFVHNGNFIMIPSAILILLPLCCPVFPSEISSLVKPEPNFATKQGVLSSTIHGIIAALSYAALAASAIFGAIYLKQRKSLRKKIVSASDEKTPSLEILEKSLILFLTTSASIMFTAVISGIISVKNIDITPLFALKFFAGGAIFVTQVVLCVAALTGRIRGAKLSKFAIVLFIIALITLIPIEIRTAI